MNNETATVTEKKILQMDLLEKAANLGALIGNQTEEEEKNGRLMRSTVNALREAGYYRLFLPKSLGGIEADPVTTAQVVEEISRHNVAAGWSLMVANTAHWWCCRLHEKGVEQIYQNGPDTFLAGAFHPPMKATPVDGGYVINGRTPLTSNVHEAEWISVTAMVFEDGQMKVNNGIPEVRMVMMHATQCQVIDTWQTIGMKATDSNDVVAGDIFVPTHLTCVLSPVFESSEYFNGSLYRFPALGVSIASLIAPVALAIARSAINEIMILADKKVPFGSSTSIRERGSVQRKLGIAEALVQSARAYLYQTLSNCWTKVLAGNTISLEERAELILAATHTNQSCLQAVDMMYSVSGTHGIYLKNRLAHLFADAQVIRQHGFANESRYETVAQVYFGLQPDLPVVAF